MQCFRLENNSSFDIPTAQIIAALSHQVNDFNHHWPGAHQVCDDLDKQEYTMYIVDDIPEAPGAIAYHDITADGRPYAKLGANVIFHNGGHATVGALSVSTALGHELLETIGNPMCDLLVEYNAAGDETCRETADACENDYYEYHGVALTNYLYPSWFNPFGKPPFDRMGLIKYPFEVRPQGYIIVKSGGRYSNIWGREYPAYRIPFHGRAAKIMHL